MKYNYLSKPLRTKGQIRKQIIKIHNIYLRCLMKHVICSYWHIIMVINMKLLAHKIHYQIFLSITNNRRCVMVSYNFLVIWEFPFRFLVYAAVPNSCNWLLITDVIISWSRFSCIGFEARYQLFWFDYIKCDKIVGYQMLNVVVLYQYLCLGM